MPVPYTFGTATASIPLSQLDSNFATAITIGNTAVQLGNTVTTLNNLTLANVTISSGNVTITNVAVTTANVSGTANVSTMVVIGNESVGGNTTVTGNISASNITLTGGTANGVAYLNTSKALTTGTGFVFDGSNVGINTSTPQEKLEVKSATSTQILVGAGGGFTYGIGRETTFGYLRFYGNQTGATGYIFTGVDGERMRIDSSGNVGIGTTTTNGVLNISYGNISPNGSGNMTGGVIFENGFGGYATHFGGGGTYGANWINSAYSNNSGISAPLAFATGAIERMRIDSSGNVGIGTASPNASAILDAQSTTKGVRFPNMTTTQKNAISSPAAGLVVFDTTLSKLCVYSGSAWQTITSV